MDYEDEFLFPNDDEYDPNEVNDNTNIYSQGFDASEQSSSSSSTTTHPYPTPPSHVHSSSSSFTTPSVNPGICPVPIDSSSSGLNRATDVPIIVSSSTANKSTADENEDDEDVCRICRCESSTDAPLYTPCRCSGSVARIHDRCLRQWLSMSNKETCELCHYRYRFSPVFAPNTPSSLPWSESIKVILYYLLKTTLPRIFHIAVCIFVWLIIIPIVSSWIYRGWIHFPSLTTDTIAIRISTFQYRFQDWFTGIGIIIFLIAAVFVNTFGGDALVKRARELDLKATRYKEIMNKLYPHQEKILQSLTKYEKRLENEKRTQELLGLGGNTNADGGNTSNVSLSSSSSSSSVTTTQDDNDRPLLPTGYIRPRHRTSSSSHNTPRSPRSSTHRSMHASSNDEMMDDETLLDDTGSCKGCIARTLHYVGIPYTLGKCITVTILCYVFLSIFLFAMISEVSSLYTYAQLFTFVYLCIECTLTIRRHYKDFPTGWEEGTVRNVMDYEERLSSNRTVVLSNAGGSLSSVRRTETNEEKEYKIKKEVIKWRWATRMTLYNALRKKVRDSLIALVIIPLLLLRPSKWFIHSILRIDPFLPYRIAIGWPLTDNNNMMMMVNPGGSSNSSNTSNPLMDNTNITTDNSTVPLSVPFIKSISNDTMLHGSNSTTIPSSLSSILSSAISSFTAYIWNESDSIDSMSSISVQEWLKQQPNHRFHSAVPVTDTATLTIAIFWYVWTGVLIITASIFIGLLIVPEPRRNPHILLHKLQLLVQNAIQQIVPPPPPPPILLPPQPPVPNGLPTVVPEENNVPTVPEAWTDVRSVPSSTVPNMEIRNENVEESLDHSFHSTDEPNYFTDNDNQDILLPPPTDFSHDENTVTETNTDNGTNSNDEWQVVQSRKRRRSLSQHQLNDQHISPSLNYPSSTTSSPTINNNDNNPAMVPRSSTVHHRTNLPHRLLQSSPISTPSSSHPPVVPLTNATPVVPPIVPVPRNFDQRLPPVRLPQPIADDDDDSNDSYNDNNDNDDEQANPNLPNPDENNNNDNNNNVNNNPDDLQNFVWDDDADGINGIGNLGDDDDELGVPLAEILGLRPPLTNLLLYACVGSTLIFVGIGLFIAMPILSTRSGILFLRTRRWLSLVFDWNIFAWRTHPIVTEPIVSSNDALFLMKGYLSMLGVLVFIGLIDEITRLFFRLYRAVRLTVIHFAFWLKYGSLSKQSSFFARWCSIFIHDSSVFSRSIVSQRILGKKLWLAQRTLIRIEKYILPSPLRKYITENWPDRDVQGWLTSSASVRSAVLLTRLSALLILKIIIVPFLIGCISAWAIQPITSSLVTSDMYLPTDINDTLFLPSVSNGIQLLETRISWLLHTPLSFLLAHWLLGVATLGITGALLMQLREAIRYEGLAQWTMSPGASNSNVRAIFEAPIWYHLLSSSIVLSMITFIFTFAVRIPSFLMVHSGSNASSFFQPYDVSNVSSALRNTSNEWNYTVNTTIDSTTENVQVSSPLSVAVPSGAEIDTLTFTKAYLGASLRGDFTRGTITVLSTNCVPVENIQPGYANESPSPNNNDVFLTNYSALTFPPSCPPNRIMAFRLFIQMEKSGGKGIPLSDALTAVDDDKTLPFSYGGLPGMASEMQRYNNNKRKLSSSLSSASSIPTNESNGTMVDSKTTNTYDPENHDWIDWLVDQIIHWSTQLPSLVPNTTTVVLYEVTESIVNVTGSLGIETVHLFGELWEYTFGLSTVYFDTSMNPLFTPSEPYNVPTTAPSLSTETANTTNTVPSNDTITKDSSSNISYLPANEAPYFNVTIYQGSREFEILSPLVWLSLDMRKSILLNLLTNTSGIHNASFPFVVIDELPIGLPSSLYTMQINTPTVDNDNSSSTNNTTDSDTLPDTASSTASKEPLVEYFFKVMPVFKFSSLSGQQAHRRMLDDNRIDSFTLPSPKGYVHSWRIRNHGAVYLQTEDFVSTENITSSSAITGSTVTKLTTKVSGSTYQVGAWENISPLSTVRNISRWFVPSYTGRRAIDSTSVWWVPSVATVPSLDIPSPLLSAYPGLRIPTGFGASLYNVKQVTENTSNNNSSNIGTLGLVTSGPFAGMRRCLNLNMIAQDYFTTKSRDWVTDGHTSKHNNHETVSVVSSTNATDNTTVLSVNETGPSVDPVTVRVFHSYVIRDDGMVIDCGLAPPPAETFASLLPPPVASLVLHFHPPPDAIVTHSTVTREEKKVDLVNHVPLLPTNTLRVQWNRYFPSLDYNASDEDTNTVRLSFLTRIIRWGDITLNRTMVNSMAILHSIEELMDIRIVEILHSIGCSVKDTLYGLVYMVHLYLTYGYSLLFNISLFITSGLKWVLPFPLQIAYHYAPWLMPFDSLLMLISVLISVEVLKAFAWMMSTTWMGFIANCLKVTKQILPPKETIRVHVFTISPAVANPMVNPLPSANTKEKETNNGEVFDEIEASRIGRKESKYLLDVTKGLTEIPQYMVTDEEGKVYETNLSSPYLYPLTAQVDMEFNRHVDSTPGVGKFRPPIGTWIQSVRQYRGGPIRRIDPAFPQDDRLGGGRNAGNNPNHNNNNLDQEIGIQLNNLNGLLDPDDGDILNIVAQNPNNIVLEPIVQAEPVLPGRRRQRGAGGVRIDRPRAAARAVQAPMDEMIPPRRRGGGQGGPQLVPVRDENMIAIPIPGNTGRSSSSSSSTSSASSKFPRAAYIRAVIEWTQLNNVADALLYIAIAGGSRSSSLMNHIRSLSSNSTAQDIVEALESITEEPPVTTDNTVLSSSPTVPSTTSRRIPRVWTDDVRQQFREISTYRDHLKRLWEKADARSKAALVNALKTLPKPSLTASRHVPGTSSNDETDTTNDEILHEEEVDEPVVNNNNDDNNNNNDQRTDRAGTLSLAAILTAPLQEVVMGTAVPYGWEYGDDNETAKAQEELCVRFRVAYMGDGLATDIDPLNTPMESILAFRTLRERQQFIRQQALRARNRLNTFLDGVYRDSIVNGDATRGAVGLKRNEMQIFGYDEEWWKFTDLVVLPPTIAMHPNTPWSRPRNSEYIGPTLPATLAYLVGVETGAIQAHGYLSHGTVFISHSDFARGIGLVTTNAPIKYYNNPSTEASINERHAASPVVSSASIATYNTAHHSRGSAKSAVLPDAPLIRVRPDKLSLLLQETLACEEAISEITPETLRQARIRYAEAAYDLDKCAYNPGSLLDPERTRKHFEARGIMVDSKQRTFYQRNEGRDTNRTKLDESESTGDPPTASINTNNSRNPLDQLVEMARKQAALDRGMNSGTGTINIPLARNNDLLPPNNDNNANNNNNPVASLQVQFVRSIDPVGSDRRPYQCRDHVLPFFAARHVLLPRVLTGRGVQIDDGVLTHLPELAHFSRHTTENGSSNIGVSSSTPQPLTKNAVQIPQQLWPEACFVCGCTAEEIGVYRQLYPVYVRQNTPLINIAYTIHPDNDKSSTVPSHEHKSSCFVCDERCLDLIRTSSTLQNYIVQTTKLVDDSSTPTNQLVWAVPLRGKVRNPVSVAKKGAANDVPNRTYSWSNVWQFIQSTRSFRWLNTLSIVSLRLPLFIALCFWFGWIITASSIGLATRTGRMLFSSSGIPAIFHHDPIAIIGGGYIFLFCLDVVLIGYYAMLSTISGLVRRYAMAVSRLAVLLEDGWNVSNAPITTNNSTGAGSRSIISTTSTPGRGSLQSTNPVPKVAIAVPPAIRAYLEQQNLQSSSSSSSSSVYTIDLFDLAVEGFDQVLTSKGIRSVYYRLRHWLLRNSLYYLAISLWRRTSCVALDIGNVHHVSREMTIRRALAAVQLAVGILFVFPVILGFLYSTLTDPITLIVNMFTLIRGGLVSLSIFQDTTVTHWIQSIPYGRVLRNFLEPINDPAWRATTSSSSLFQLWCTGALVVALVVELCFTGVFGDRSRTWIELLEWRFISAYTSRIWSWQIKPFLGTLLYVTICIFTTTIVSLSTFTFIFVIQKNTVDNNNDDDKIVGLSLLTLVLRYTQLTVLSIIVIGGVYRLYTLRHSNRTLLRWRQNWDNWTTELRKQKYQIATILQNYPSALRQSSSNLRK